MSPRHLAFDFIRSDQKSLKMALNDCFNLIRLINVWETLKGENLKKGGTHSAIQISSPSSMAVTLGPRLPHTKRLKKSTTKPYDLTLGKWWYYLFAQLNFIFIRKERSEK